MHVFEGKVSESSSQKLKKKEREREQNKCKESRKKEIIKVKADNKIQNNNSEHLCNQKLVFKKINKINNPVVSLIFKRGSNIRNKNENLILYPTDINIRDI